MRTWPTPASPSTSTWPAGTLRPAAATEIGPGTVMLETVTSRSGIRIVLAARTHVHRAGVPLDAPMSAVGDCSLSIGHAFTVELAAGKPVTAEKTVAVATSRDGAISTPAEAARFHLQQAGDFGELLAAHERAWVRLWEDFAITVTAAGSQAGLALNVHAFHVLQPPPAPPSTSMRASAPAVCTGRATAVTCSATSCSSIRCSRCAALS
jgi:trehalose/maltose hydrolase-like predicted phosphorylase